MYYSLHKTPAYVALTPDVLSLDSEVSPQFKHVFLELHAAQAGGLFILDLSQVATADSAGLAFLLFASRCVRNAEGRLILVSVSAPVRKLLAISRIEASFEIHKSLPEALFVLTGTRTPSRGRSRVTGLPVANDAHSLEQHLTEQLTGQTVVETSDTPESFFLRTSGGEGEGACQSEAFPADYPNGQRLDATTAAKTAFDLVRGERYEEPPTTDRLTAIKPVFDQIREECCGALYRSDSVVDWQGGYYYLRARHSF